MMKMPASLPAALSLFIACACNEQAPEDIPAAGMQQAVPDKTAVPPDAGHVLHERIVFSSLRPGNWDIYYFSEPGTTPERLTRHPGLDYDAEFSPDGRWVVFTSERRGNPDLYVIDLMDREAQPRLLIDSVAMEDQATISPDGKTMAFVSTYNGDADIYTIKFDPQITLLMSEAVNLTRDPGGDFRPAFSPDGARIAFSSDRDNPPFGDPYLSFSRQREGDVYVMDSDGRNVSRLTDTRDWDGSPEWSGDGKTIYFYSARPRVLPGPPQSPILGQEGGFRIWAMKADGFDQRPLTPEGLEALAPALTPDGRVAFQTRQGYTRWSVQSVNLEGTDLRMESDESNDYWLPDYHMGTGAMVCHGVGPTVEETQAVEAILGSGALLAADYPVQTDIPDRILTLYPMRHTTGLAPHPFRDEVVVTIENEQGSRLVLADFAGKNQRELFTAPGIGIVSGTRVRLFDMKYSDDGEWITYTQGYFAGETSHRSDLWIMRADGSERVNLTEDTDANDGVAGFSPDGKKIVFRSSRSGNFELYTMNLDGSTITRLTDHPSRDNFPVFSPEGDAIAFSSDRDSGVDALGFRTFDNYILRLQPDGSPGTLHRITDDPSQDSHPVFSPDAKWVAYTSERDGISDEEPLVQEVLFGPQMYGEIYVQRLSDGLIIRLTHNKWEEGVPFWLGPLK